MTKTFPEVISGIRTAKRGVEVREDIAQMGEYVEQFAATATEKAEAAAASEKKASDAVANIDQQTDDAVTTVTNARKTALDDVETARTGALTDIGNARAGALEDIETARSGAVKDVTDTKAAALTALDTARQNTLQEEADSRESALTALEEKRAAALQEMQGSVDAAAGSATKAATSESNAKESEDAAKASEEAAVKSEAAAKASKEAAEKSEANALKHSQEAGAKAGTDSTLTVSGAPADAKAVGDELAVRYTKEEIQKLIEDSLAAYREEEYAKIKFWVSNDPTSPAEMFGGTWEQIAADRALMGASSSHAAGSTAEAGLPNVRGGLYDTWHGANPWGNGPFGASETGGSGLRSGSDYYMHWGDISFDASKSNSIYGKSSTVQPPAYFVNVWQRIE